MPKTMKRRDFLKRLSLAAMTAFPLLPGKSRAKAPLRRPNFVFIITDDQRWDAMSCMGHPFLKTPNIDRIRNEGVLFSNAFTTTSLCSPSRAGFLTGCYASRHGVVNNYREFDPEITPSFPMLLHNSGYKTAYIGKWHLGNHGNPREGFDYWLSFKGQGRYFNPTLNENGTQFKKKGYITDILTQYALDFLDRQKKDVPFSLCLSHKAVHQSFKPAPRHRGVYRDREIPEPPAFRDSFETKPAWQRSLLSWVKRSREKIPKSRPNTGPWIAPKSHTNYFETLAAVDEGVGKILDKLEAVGELDNTIVVYCSDNGFMLGEHRRGDKRVAYEESMRIPMIMRCPKLVKPGSTVDELVLNIDVAPTFLNAAGVEIPDSVQGASMLPLLKGHTAPWRQSVFYSYWLEYSPSIPTMVAVRTKNFKLIRYPDLDDIDELYDLKNDPHEMTNLAQLPKYAAKKEILNKELERLMKETAYLPQVPAPGRKAAALKAKKGVLLDLSFESVSQNKVVNRGGSDFSHSLHGVAAQTDGEKTRAVFTKTSHITFEKVTSLHPAPGTWVVELTFTPRQDGIVFSLGTKTQFVMVMVENGIPSLVIGRDPAAYIIEGDSNRLGKSMHLKVCVDSVRSQLFINGQKSSSMVIRNPVPVKPNYLILGYNRRLSPNDRFIPRKRERFLPKTAFSGEIETFSISRK